MSFKIPAISYPLSVDTIGKTLAMGGEISASCLTLHCGNRSRINLVSIAKKHGMGYPNGHDALLRIVFCQRCREAGRPDKDIHFTYQPLSDPHSHWPRQEPSPSRYAVNR